MGERMSQHPCCRLQTSVLFPNFVLLSADLGSHSPVVDSTRLLLFLESMSSTTTSILGLPIFEGKQSKFSTTVSLN